MRVPCQPSLAGWRYDESAVGQTAVLACWCDDELAAGRTAVLAHWRNDESAAGRMTIPQHRRQSLTRLCNGGGGGVNDGTSALLTVPRSLGRQ